MHMINMMPAVTIRPVAMERLCIFNEGPVRFNGRVTQDHSKGKLCGIEVVAAKNVLKNAASAYLSQ